MKDFLSNPDIQEKISKASQEANEHVRKLQPATSVSAGDLFLFAETLELPVRWAAVLTHADDRDLWFLVAADDFPLVGSCDIELAEDEPLAPLTLRLGAGLWAHESDIELDKHVGRIDAAYMEYAKERLSAMVSGELPDTETSRLAETAPEYEQWVGELSQAAEQIERRLHAEPVVLGLDAFKTDWASFLRTAEAPAPQAALAADSVGATEAETLTSGSVLKSKLPGKLVALLHDKEVDLLYAPSNDTDAPPPVTLPEQPSESRASWQKKPDGRWLWSAPILLKDGQATFHVGEETFSIRL